MRLAGADPASAASIIGHWVPLDLLASGVPPDVSTDLAAGLAPNKPAEAALALAVPDAPGDYLLILDIVTPERGSLAAAGIDPTIIRIHVVAPALPTPGTGRQPGRDHRPEEHDRGRRGTIGACPRRLPRWSAPTHPTSTPPTTPGRTPPATGSTISRRTSPRSHSRRRRHGPPRHRVLDGPDDDRARGLLPRGADTAEERLGYYASRFPLVEVDATYYALPARRTAELWVERTPPDFTFDIKAHALMTGQPTETKRLPKDLREALPAELAAKAAHLREGPAGRPARRRLGAGSPTGSSRSRRPASSARSCSSTRAGSSPRRRTATTIEEAVGRLRDAGMTGAVEFRSASWFNEKNLERTIGVPRRPEDPARHRRRAAGLQVERPADRRRDLAGPRDRALPRPAGRDLGGEGHPDRRALPLPVRRDELADWAPRVRETAGQAKDTHVLFNNCYANYGATNALELAQLLLDLEAGR